MVLPNATTTELVVTGNLHAWKDFITLRTTPAAQSEIRYVAKDIQSILRLECPNIFGLTNGE
jgi:thymidylate synthase ThyX